MPDPNLSSFIWSVADLLRGDYKQSDYGKVILPFTVLRRLDCVLEATKPEVLSECRVREDSGLNPEPFLLRKAGQHFYNTSPLDLKKLMGDQDHIGENLRAYLQSFSPAVRDIFESFDFHTQIDRLAKSGLLYLVTEKFAGIDLHPDAVSNAQTGAVFEELIRKFAELSNETAGEHFTPREVIRLMVNLSSSRMMPRSPGPASYAPCTTRPPAPAACSRSAASTCQLERPFRNRRYGDFQPETRFFNRATGDSEPERPLLNRRERGSIKCQRSSFGRSGDFQLERPLLNRRTGASLPDGRILNRRTRASFPSRPRVISPSGGSATTWPVDSTSPDFPEGAHGRRRTPSEQVKRPDRAVGLGPHFPSRVKKSLSHSLPSLPVSKPVFGIEQRCPARAGDSAVR